ncbi:MAG TPA: hydrogenase nickel incorporation protein HypB [Polyangiaceae bacterium]|jgi:hydrogenase nickel incorporation protein HypB|nr:MAG: Hydrogenase isoenzymes nickel incorporation protein HypB [Deltaproteobacteria bacterium ADurb.Bin207]HNS95400.1 hydrogenase nickel incorporation protein HypB [Polyangiaceae bacterium]HNZ20660.1 hydrogenase nickel incorporation protein HypB [Polyangiaceae bacterium]HOD20724.1 hydrogenase nickel incorporation protein HypB [Polyangiaceae bacterium]HOE47144.1 hydrogenase nickel incorporation protein HypB [Polyangiaceae bacterium]
MTTVRVIRDILEANDRIARDNAGLFSRSGVFVINLMSSPGAGKTTLLERTIERLAQRMKIGVIEGDIQSSIDAERIERHGVKAVQINTGGACHLDGNMIRDALDEFDLDTLDLLVVENVGNLVCPAEFQVGEDMKVMLLSVTEGDDKPLKYPLMFQQSRALVIHKIDLLPYVNCSVEAIEQRARALRNDIEIFQVSSTRGDGLEPWVEWLASQVANKRG